MMDARWQKRLTESSGLSVGYHSDMQRDNLVLSLHTYSVRNLQLFAQAIFLADRT